MTESISVMRDEPPKNYSVTHRSDQGPVEIKPRANLNSFETLRKNATKRQQTWYTHTLNPSQSDPKSAGDPFNQRCVTRHPLWGVLRHSLSTTPTKCSKTPLPWFGRDAIHFVAHPCLFLVRLRSRAVHRNAITILVGSAAVIHVR